MYLGYGTEGATRLFDKICVSKVLPWQHEVERGSVGDWCVVRAPPWNLCGSGEVIIVEGVVDVL